MRSRFMPSISLFFFVLLCMGWAGEPAAGEKTPKSAVKVIKKVAPVYPEEAKKEGITGKVVLDATVNEQGKVNDVKTIESANPSLEKAAIDAVKQWEFAPLQKDGKNVTFITTLTLNFALDKEKDKPDSAK